MSDNPSYPETGLPLGLLDAEASIEELYKASLTYDSRKDFAQAIGLSPQHLGQIMNGRKPISGSVAAYLGLRRAEVYEMADPECPYMVQSKKHFIRRGRVYDEALAAALERGEDRVLPVEVYDGATEQRHVRMARARLATVEMRPRTRKSRYVATTMTSARPLPAKRNTMSLSAVRELAERDEPPNGRELKLAFSRLRQVMHPASRVTEESRLEGMVLFEKLRMYAPNVPITTEKRDPATIRGRQKPQLKAGQILRQKQVLLSSLSRGGIVTVTDDHPIKLAAAEELLMDDLAEKYSDEEERVSGGQMRAGMSKRRTRRVLRIMRGSEKI